MARKQRQNSPYSIEAEVNLTPLVDVVFVILMAFIVIAPLIEMDVVDLAPSPKENSHLAPPNSSVKIHVYKDNTIWLNKQQVTLKELEARLSLTKEENPKEVPFLFHDRSAHFGTYQMVKNIVEEVGFPQMHVALSPV